MSKINRNRLHLLISGACGVAAAAYGISLIISVYTPFANEMIWNHQVQYIERTTGKSFTQWQQERSIRCSKEAAEQKPTVGVFGLFPDEVKDNYYRGCMRPIFELVPDRKIVGAFLLSNAHWVLLYLVASSFISWFIGYLLTKAIPGGTGRLWAWLTAGHEPK